MFVGDGVSVPHYTMQAKVFSKRVAACVYTCTLYIVHTKFLAHFIKVWLNAFMRMCVQSSKNTQKSHHLCFFFKYINVWQWLYFSLYGINFKGRQKNFPTIGCDKWNMTWNFLFNARVCVLPFKNCAVGTPPKKSILLT